LAQIGALDAALAAGAKITQMSGHEADENRPVLNVHYDPKGVGRFGLGIHRASLFDALWQAAQARDIRFQAGSDIKSAHNGQLTLADGTQTQQYDLIVDATGAGSPLSALRGTPLPYGAIWGTVDWPQTDLPTTQLTQAYRRADHMIGVLPIGKPTPDKPAQAAIFWSMRADSYDTWQSAGLAKWKAEATALWPAFAPFADQITDPAQMTMARYTHGTLRKPYSNRLVHIGDAAHRASPQLGQGANMALLDALALTRALDLADGQNPLQLYAQARRAHVWSYQTFSRVFTPQYQSDSRILPKLRDRVFYPASQIGPIPRLLSALVCGTMLPPLGSLARHP